MTPYTQKQIQALRRKLAHTWSAPLPRSAYHERRLRRLQALTQQITLHDYTWYRAHFDRRTRRDLLQITRRRQYTIRADQEWANFLADETAIPTTRLCGHSMETLLAARQRALEAMLA